MDDVGNSPGEPWLLGRDIVWHNPTNPCKCTGKSDSNHADNVQILLPTEISREISQEIRSDEPEDNSAFIFGFNPESSWHWQEFGNPTKVPSSSLLDQFQDLVSSNDSAIGSELENSQSPPAPAKLYTAGILCTLPEEGAAMKTLFDKVYYELDNYVLGSISNHNVVLAYLPLESGIAAASAAASKLAADFPNVKFGLLVGIAGGVPSTTTDIRLGDVVVGVPKDTHPGVIQLGRGKDLEQNGFQRTGSLNRPPGFLLSAVAALTAEPQKCRIQLNNHIRGVVESNPKYQYPGQHLDVLTSAPCDQCRSKCSDRDNHILDRQPRDLEYPVVHLGLIGSGDTVIKDSKKRDELAKQFGILCVEMEAAGVMHSDIPFLVIRGISDYADSQKNNQWHNYASLAAAAFATMLLYQYTGTDITIKPTQTGLKRSLSQKNLTPRTRRRLDENYSYSS
ncbi:nucleoside phosphorylase domain-containing protein [Hypoxylon argillaceum]|nr:nucleoside phosphorylase domain-containing protein [Hypoxylon argillaceum]